MKDTTRLCTDVFTIARDTAGLKEQGLGTVHPEILLGSDFGPVT